jgi:hypothetical protein
VSALLQITLLKPVALIVEVKGVAVAGIVVVTVVVPSGMITA